MAVLKLVPSFKNYLWGGTKLKDDYNKQYTGDALAESWELSCHIDGTTTIAEGLFQGKTLKEYIDWEGKKVLGAHCQRFTDFPILIKLIDAKEDLSIQVHPSDDYALANEGQYGKTEMWYIVDCEAEAVLYYGFSKKIEQEEFLRRIEDATVLEVLNKIPVQKGDVFFIEAGVVHAIGKGIVIAEIQQNSNVTYRVYDYGRRDKNGEQRELHIQKALEVMSREPKLRSNTFEPHLGVCPYFNVDKVMLDGKTLQKIGGIVNQDSFLHILVLEGEGTIGNANTILFQKGDSILLTAGTGAYEITGNCSALLTTIP